MMILHSILLMYNTLQTLEHRHQSWFLLIQETIMKTMMKTMMKTVMKTMINDLDSPRLAHSVAV